MSTCSCAERARRIGAHARPLGAPAPHQGRKKRGVPKRHLRRRARSASAVPRPRSSRRLLPSIPHGESGAQPPPLAGRAEPTVRGGETPVEAREGRPAAATTGETASSRAQRDAPRPVRGDLLCRLRWGRVGAPRARLLWLRALGSLDVPQRECPRRLSSDVARIPSRRRGGRNSADIVITSDDVEARGPSHLPGALIDVTIVSPTDNQSSPGRGGDDGGEGEG
jgi:hypothetical protein